MTNETLLQEYVAQSGYKLCHMAKVIGISTNTLRVKLKGETEFKVGEAQRLAELLSLTSEQRDDCFFGA